MNMRIPTPIAVNLPPRPEPDAARLADWLRPRVPGIGSGPLQLQRIEGGQSNPSWVLRSAAQSWVLRAKPGPAAGLPPSAHAIEREFQVMQAMRKADIPVAPVRVLCEDESVIGAAFYLMDFVPGRVLRDSGLPGIARAERAAYHWEANRVLAQLHQVPWARHGLQDFGRAGGFFERLVRRWSQQYRASAALTRPIEAMEQLAAWLPAHIPAGADDAEHTRLTHGDYRIENLMFHPERPEVVAVLDWELSTLGHPLSDLAYHCAAWHLPSGLLRGFGDSEPAALGIPGEREYLQRYCEHTGRALSQVLADWPFYLACNLFRLGAILAGIGVRVQQGTATHSSAADIASLAEPVAQLGWDIAQERAPALRN